MIAIERFSCGNRKMDTDSKGTFLKCATAWDMLDDIEDNDNQQVMLDKIAAYKESLK